MNDKVYLTIVISYYNLKFFEDTLKSLACQKNKNFKVFIGSDKSPENPEEIITKYNKELCINYISFKENIGGQDLTLQWKRCLEYVDTPYFLILGDDDMISVNTIEEFNKMIYEEGEKYNVYRLCIQRIDEDGKETSKIIQYDDNQKSTSFTVKRAKNEVVSSLGEYVFSTKEYRRVGVKSFPKAFYSDNMMVLEISNFKIIKNIENAIAFIRVSKQSFSGNKDNIKHIRDAAALFHYKLLKEYEEEFLKSDLKYFLPYIFYGYKNKVLSISIIEIVKMIFKFNGFGILIKILKQKIRRI